MTYSQILYRQGRFKRKVRQYKKKDIKGCPQKKGVCLKIFKLTPKKPNSAKRSVARVTISTRKVISCYIRGETHNLKKFCEVLVHGGRVRDVPGMRYRLIRGKFDFLGLLNRRSRRSTYGTRNFSRARK
jgi:small subunit ribosomal protein S12